MFCGFTFRKRDSVGKQDYLSWKMLGENNSNSSVPVFLDENQLQYPPNASNQLQLFGNGEYFIS